MSELILDISVSVDGYVAGPNPTDEEPLGEGGELLHEWIISTKAWRESHGYEGGDEGIDSDMSARMTAGVGAHIMGRRMYSGGSGGWEDDSHARGWWGDEPPFHNPVFVLTHHARDPLPMEGGTTFTFVTDGFASALEQARAGAGGKDVAISGGAEVAQQYLRAGLVDEMRLHVAPVFLGAGARLFDGHVTDAPATLQRTDVQTSPTGVVHVTYRRAG